MTTLADINARNRQFFEKVREHPEYRNIRPDKRPDALKVKIDVMPLPEMFGLTKDQFEVKVEPIERGK
jgi:hypothetical protein